MSAMTEFRRDLPHDRQAHGLRFVARRFQREIEKMTPPAPDIQPQGPVPYAMPGRGVNGESSN